MLLRGCLKSTSSRLSGGITPFAWSAPPRISVASDSSSLLATGLIALRNTRSVLFKHPLRWEVLGRYLRYRNPKSLLPVRHCEKSAVAPRWYHLSSYKISQVSSVLIWVLSCSQPLPSVNRVQANALSKAIFQGQWYYRKTVIDLPYNAGITWVGDQGTNGSVDKIIWDIQEDYLIARRSYSYIRSGEPEGIAGGTEEGAAVAMYRIESHFDIQREYNSVTGEEMNVVIENSLDRPWYQRDYMRVDWSENLITDFKFLTSAKLLGGMKLEPVSYYVQDLQAGHPHRPKFERATDSEDITYIDIVNKVFAEPELREVPGRKEKLPHCFFFHTSHIDCTPVEITVRNAFYKVDGNREYQSKIQTGDRMERAGFFYVERAGYDRQYGVVEPLRYRFYVRHNIWKESFQKDEKGDTISCASENEAEVCSGTGSICDLDVGRAHGTSAISGHLQGVCTLPYRQRVIRPIVYYLSRNFPQYLIKPVQHAISDWNEAFVQTVASLRENECLDDEKSNSECAAERERKDARNILILCHNPVSQSDHPACGEEGDKVDFGDLRYSMIGWVNEPHLYSPLGYGPSSADPETGEIIVSNALLYGAGFERAVSFGRDILALLLGDLDEGDIRNGEQVRAWVQQLQGTSSQPKKRPVEHHIVSIDADDLERVSQAMDFSWARQVEDSDVLSKATFKNFMDRTAEAQDHLSHQFVFGKENKPSGLAGLLNTDIEQMLVNSENLLMVGLDPQTPIQGDVLEQASPLRAGSLFDQASTLDKLRRDAAMQTCILFQEFADTSMLGLAREISRAVRSGDGTVTWHDETYRIVDEQGLVDYRAVRDALMAKLVGSVTIHEVGHTLGLFHNFSGSYDALNYHRRYWELREDGNMAPRAWDPLTDSEIDGHISDYAYSSVMDYSEDMIQSQGEIGLGYYDVAAVKLGYGDLVEVFEEVEDRNAVSLIGFLQRLRYPVQLTYNSLVGMSNDFEIKAHNYIDIVTNVIGGSERLSKRADVDYGQLQSDPVLLAQDIDDPSLDAKGRPAVPYRFCNDYLSEVRPECQRYDAGADPYESIQSIIDHYWYYHVFNAYRRERLGFEVATYVDRIINRYLIKLQRANQVYTLYRSLFEQMYKGNESLPGFWVRPDGMGAWTLAAAAAYQLLTKVITTPEPGNYMVRATGTGLDALKQTMGAGTVTIGYSDGRPLETTWDTQRGYYSFENIDRVGFYYDKVAALEAITNPNTYFIARDTAPDIRRYQISFYSSFAPAVTNFMRGLLTEDWQTVAPRWDQDRVLQVNSFDLGLGSRPGVPIDPNASFSIQLHAAVLSMALIPETFDQSYFNSARIFLRGSAESIDLDPSLELVEFVDPMSGLIYQAGSYLDEQGRETGIGAQMLLHAQQLLDNDALQELENYLDIIDLVRRLTWTLGYRN